MIETLVRTFLNKVVDEDTHDSDQYMPAVEDELWAEVFSYAPEELKGKVAHRWLAIFNQSIDKRSFLNKNKSSVLIDYIEKHYAFVAKIQPYLDKSLLVDEYFDCSANGVLKHLGHTLTDRDYSKIEQRVEHLWFGNTEQKIAALHTLPPILLSLDNPDEEAPRYGTLIARLGWKTLDDLQLKSTHTRSAIFLSQECGLMDVYPTISGDSRHDLWHALTYFSRQPMFYRDAATYDGFDPSDWHGLDIRQELAKTEISNIALAFRNILVWNARSSNKDSIQQPLLEQSLFKHLHPEDTTILDVLNRWLPQAKSVWAYTAAIGGTLEEAVNLALSVSPAAVSLPSSLPDDLSNIHA